MYNINDINIYINNVCNIYHIPTNIVTNIKFNNNDVTIYLDFLL